MHECITRSVMPTLVTACLCRDLPSARDGAKLSAQEAPP